MLLKVIVTCASAGTVIVDMLNARFWAVRLTATAPGMVGTVVTVAVAAVVGIVVVGRTVVTVGTGVVTVTVGAGVVAVVVGTVVVAVVSGTVTVIFGMSVVTVVIGTDVVVVVTGSVTEPDGGTYMKSGNGVESCSMYSDALNVEVGVTVEVTVVDGVATAVPDEDVVGVAVAVPGSDVSVAEAVLMAVTVADVPGVPVTRVVAVGVAFVDGVVVQPATRARTTTSAAIAASVL